MAAPGFLAGPRLLGFGPGIYAAAGTQGQFFHNDFLIVWRQRKIGMQFRTDHVFDLLRFFPYFKQFVISQSFDALCKGFFVSKGIQEAICFLP